MVKSRVKKNVSKNVRSVMKLSFELDCVGCAKKYIHKHASSKPYEFAGKSESGCKAHDIRALLQRKSGKARQKKSWSSSHSDLMRVILEVFGDKHLTITPAVFEFKEDFLRKKAAELALPRSQPASPKPARGSYTP